MRLKKADNQEWLDEDLFKPSGDKKAHPYSIVIPPPNVTGKLHLGHAWDTAIQDTLIRFKRMGRLRYFVLTKDGPRRNRYPS